MLQIYLSKSKRPPVFAKLGTNKLSCYEPYCFCSATVDKQLLACDNSYNIILLNEAD